MIPAFGQGNIQGFRGDDSVVKEHFIEVAHPIQEDTVLMLFSDGQVLLHHGSSGVSRLRHGEDTVCFPQEPENRDS